MKIKCVATHEAPITYRVEDREFRFARGDEMDVDVDAAMALLASNRFELVDFTDVPVEDEVAQAPEIVSAMSESEPMMDGADLETESQEEERVESENKEETVVPVEEVIETPSEKRRKSKK